MNHIIGIDLGTTNCCAAVVVDGKPVVIPNPQGGLVTPSVVSFEDDGTCLVGEPARRRAILHPLRTVCSVKRFMGEAYDNTKELAEAMPYRVARGNNHLPQFDGGTSWLTPQQVSAKILSQIKQNAEAFLGETVTEAIITVPAYFNDLQRQATREAGELAGFRVRRIVAEPTAAALAYGLDKNLRDEHVAVFHLGGGTFDISILNIGDGVYEVESVSGSTCLGGDDFDKAIVDWLAADFQNAHGIDLRHDPTALQRLREAAEKAKCELSSAQEAEINLPFIASSDSIPLSLSCSLSRERFDTLCAGLVEALRQPCRTAIQSARNTCGEIGKVLLVGGGTRIPAVQKTVAEIFGINPSMNVNPDEAVAIGAAIQGAILQGAVGKTLLLDALPLSYGIETEGGVMTRIMDANWTFPTKRTLTFTTTADNQTEVQLRILQGERPMANDNKTIGRVILSGITPAPKGIVQIEVTFDIDANGILCVEAKEKGKNNYLHSSVESGTNITEEDFRRRSDYYASPLSTVSSSSSSFISSASTSSSSGSSYQYSGNSTRSTDSPPSHYGLSLSSWLEEYGIIIIGILVFITIAFFLISWIRSCDDPSSNYSAPSTYTPSNPSHSYSTGHSSSLGTRPYYHTISMPGPIPDIQIVTYEPVGTYSYPDPISSKLIHNIPSFPLGLDSIPISEALFNPHSLFPEREAAYQRMLDSARNAPPEQQLKILKEYYHIGTKSHSVDEPIQDTCIEEASSDILESPAAPSPDGTDDTPMENVPLDNTPLPLAE